MPMEKNENIIAVIADDDTVLGFKLAGIQHSFSVNFASENAENVIRGLNSVISQALKTYSESGSGLLIVTEAVYELMEKHNLIKQFQNHPEITLVQIPDKTGSKGVAKRKLARLFEDAIGVAMKK